MGTRSKHSNYTDHVASKSQCEFTRGLVIVNISAEVIIGGSARSCPRAPLPFTHRSTCDFELLDTSLSTKLISKYNWTNSCFGTLTV